MHDDLFICEKILILTKIFPKKIKFRKLILELNLELNTLSKLVNILKYLK